jgi:hypothetical protein
LQRDLPTERHTTGEYNPAGSRAGDNVAFEATGTGRTGGRHAGFEIAFVDKPNSAGLQTADLTERPIGRHVLDPDQPNRERATIERKLRRSPNGAVAGWG